MTGPPPIYVVEEGEVGEGNSISEILTDETEARRIHDADRAAPASWRASNAPGYYRRHSRSVTRYDHDGTRYEPVDWP